MAVERVETGDAAAALEQALPELELSTEPEVRERYARDSSPIVRHPAAVMVPRDAGEVAGVVAAAARAGLPVTARGGGSGLAGGCLGGGLVIDTSPLGGIEPADDGSVWCGAGASLDSVNARLRLEDRMIGPDVVSSRWARVGGLIATNACGARSLRYGRFGDVLLEAEVVMADGGVLRLRPGEVPESLRTPLGSLRDGLTEALEDWPEQPRGPGGYALADFAERGDALSLIPGSEGTLGVLVGARLATVPLPASRRISVAAFSDLRSALESAAPLAASGAAAVEVLDGRLCALARDRGLDAVPDGAGAALIVEHLDGGPASVGEEVSTSPELVELDEGAAELAWAVRSRVLELVADGLEPMAAFEDPAVAPERAAGFADALLDLLQRFGFESILYGHAGAGCLHVRPLCDPADPRLGERLMDAAATVCELVGEWGGTLTGEHGWGLCRSHLAPRALGPRLFERFEAVSNAFDPESRLNPGIIVGGVDPRSLISPAPTD